MSVLFHKCQVIFVNVVRCEPKKSFERKLCWALFQFRRILVLFHCLIIQLITLRTLKFKDITMSVNYIFFYQFLRRENFSQIILVGFIYKWNYFPLANFSKFFHHSDLFWKKVGRERFKKLPGKYQWKNLIFIFFLLLTWR